MKEVMRLRSRPHMVRLYLWFWDPLELDGRAVYILPGLPAPVPGQVYYKQPVVRCWLN